MSAPTRLIEPSEPAAREPLRAASRESVQSSAAMQPPVAAFGRPSPRLARRRHSCLDPGAGQTRVSGGKRAPLHSRILNRCAPPTAVQRRSVCDAMWAYLIRRLWQMVPTLIGVVLLVFLLFKFFGADPAVILGGLNATQDQVAAIRTQLGLDRPWWVQLGIYLKEIVTFNWGRSWATNEVGEPICSRLGCRPR